MSQWGKFRKCSKCKFMDAAETETGFGCYQDKREVCTVYPERVACASFSEDMPEGYVPNRFGGWDKA